MDSEQLVQQFKEKQQERVILEPYWKDAYDVTYPQKGQRFLSGGSDGYSEAISAKDDNAEIYDSLPRVAVRTLRASIHAALTPANTQWLGFNVPGVNQQDVPDEVKIYLNNAAKTIHTLVHSSNYDSINPEGLEDLVISGQYVLYVEKEFQGPYRFQLWNFDQCYFEDRSGDGTIDTIYRQVRLTAHQAQTRFGNKTPEHIKEILKDGHRNGEKHTFIHCIYPKEGDSPRGVYAEDMAYRSVYVCAKSMDIVSDSGYHEQPFVVPRWKLLPDTEYATGPLTDALPDIKTLFRIREMTLSSMEMNLGGIFVAPHRGMMTGKNFQLRTNVINYVTDPDKVKKLNSNVQFNEALALIAGLQQSIRDALMVGDLSPMEKDYATATEVVDRSQTLRMRLGPLYSRLQSEFLHPLVTRLWGLAFRDQTLGQPPEWLANIAIVPEYFSPLARAQRMEEVAAIEQFEAHLGQLQAMNMIVADEVYDTQSALQISAAARGVPPNLLRSKQQTAQIQAKKAQMAALASAGSPSGNPTSLPEVA